VRCHKDGDEFLDRIVGVTGEEARVSVGNGETKEQSKQGMHTHSPNKPKKFKHTSARKVTAALFWVLKGELMVEFTQQGTSITSEVYCETHKKCVGPAIQNKKCGILTSDVVLPPTSDRTRALLEHFI
jgi:hypothetical protein